MYKFPEVKNAHIYLFGTGGTGGFALEFLSRLFANSNSKITIEIFDGDKVEPKNLKRQNFTRSDLDLAKTTALKKRLDDQIPNLPNVIEHPDYVTDENSLIAYILSTTDIGETPIIVSAVDNIATRRLLNNVINELSDGLDIIGIDSGNNEFGGQVVVFGNAKEIDLMQNTKPIKLPNMLQLYPEIDKINDINDENPGLVQNCAENNESKPQSMLANIRNAEVITSIIAQLVANKPLSFNLYNSSDNGLTVGKTQIKPI